MISTPSNISFYILLIISDVLQQFVPMISLAMALYLGLEGSPRKMWNWVYISVLGGFGVSSYMLLNEPAFTWVPEWMTREVWFILAMIVILVILILLFTSAIRLQDMDSPTDHLRKFYRWVLWRVNR